MREKIVAVFTVLILVTAILVGHDKLKHKEAATATAAASFEEKEKDPADMKVGVCIFGFSDKFMSLYRDELQKELVEVGFTEDNIYIVDSGGSQGHQINQIKEFIAAGVDIMIVNPVESSDAGEITDLVVAADIPLIYINREPEAVEEARWEENNWKVTYIGCDARQSGILQGNIIVDIGKEKLDRNNDGVIQYAMIRGDRRNTDSYYRTRYSVETLKEAGWTLECISDSIGNSDKNVSKAVVAKICEKRPDIEVILCNNDSMALGAVEATKKQGLKPGKDVYIVGVDAYEEALECVISGEMAGTVFNNLFEQAHLTAEAALSYAMGKSVSKFVGSDYIKVTKENATSILDVVGKNEK